MSSEMIEAANGTISVSQEQILDAKKRLMSGGYMISDNSGKARPPTDAELYVLADVGTKLGLDPMMGQIQFIGSRLYVNLAGMYDIIGRSDKVISVKSRPASPEERQAALVDKEEHYWITTLKTRDGKEFEGHGFAEPANVAIAVRSGYVDKRIIRNMAENRSKRRAMTQYIGMALHDPDDPRDVIDMTVDQRGNAEPVAMPKSITLGAYPEVPKVETAQPEQEKVAASPAAPSTVEVPARREAPQTTVEPPDFPEPTEPAEAPARPSGRMRREG